MHEIISHLPDDQNNRDARNRWGRFMTMAQARDENDGSSGLFYSPITGLWILVPDAESRWVPDEWVHFGR